MVGFGLLIVKRDPNVVYNTIMGEEGAGSTFGHIIKGIKRSAKTFMNTVFILTRRDVNQAAHVFARGYSSPVLLNRLILISFVVLLHNYIFAVYDY